MENVKNYQDNAPEVETVKAFQLSGALSLDELSTSESYYIKDAENRYFCAEHKGTGTHQKAWVGNHYTHDIMPVKFAKNPRKEESELYIDVDNLLFLHMDSDTVTGQTGSFWGTEGSPSQPRVGIRLVADGNRQFKLRMINRATPMHMYANEGKWSWLWLSTDNATTFTIHRKK